MKQEMMGSNGISRTI